MDHRRVFGTVRRHARLAITVMAVAAMVVGITVAVLPHDAGTHQPAGVLPPGSMGSLPSPHSWWDPRGWFDSGPQLPKPHRITLTRRPAGEPAGKPAPVQKTMPKPHRVRELKGRRTANARVYRLSDGRLQAAVSTTPVNYADARGHWHPIDVTVRPSARPSYRYANTSNTSRSFFGSDPAGLVRFQEPGGGWLRIGVDGAKSLRPRVAGDTVRYPHVAPGASLSYQVTPTGLKESITLASPAAAAAPFSFTVNVGGGLVPYERAGQIVFSRTGAGGPPVLVMPKPFMTDSRRVSWSPAGVSWSPRVTQDAQWDPVSRTLHVTVTPNQRWLHQPRREFPVVIDPTIVIAPTPGQAQSTVISSDTPGTPYPGSWPLSVGTTPTGAMRSLLQFTMPNSLPPGTKIDSADLRLYRDQSFGASPASQTIEVHQANGPWTTSSTWDSTHNPSDITGDEGLNEVSVDDSDGGSPPGPNADTARTGTWQTATASPATSGEYAYNQDSTPGDSFTWMPRLTEPGFYAVVAHYVATANAAASAPFTVTYSGGSQAYSINEQSGTGGVWASLGSHQFAAGNTGTVRLGDGPASSSTRVMADEVKFRLWGEAVVNPSQSNRWDSFPVRSIVQSWLDNPLGQPSNNFGFVVKTEDESVRGKGGPQYEGAVDAYGGVTANDPQLVITYGRPAVTLDPVTTIRGDGADLSWTPYADPTPNDPDSTGDNLVEYQVHRSTSQDLNPNNKNLVAPVPAGRNQLLRHVGNPEPAQRHPVGRLLHGDNQDGRRDTGTPARPRRSSCRRPDTPLR